MYNQPEVALIKYELEVKSIVKGRNAYICDTDKGLRLLLPYSGSNERVELLYDILKEIRNKGMVIEQIYKTIEGEFKSSDESGTEYILKDCYQGDEFRVGNISDMTAAMELMARFHNITEQIDKKFEVKEEVSNEYRRHFRELVKIRNYIQTKNKKNDFERIFLRVQKEYIDMAKESVDAISNYDNYIGCLWCHGQFNHHNVIVTSHGMRLINFENMCYCTPLLDISNFVRKMMEKSDWNIDVWRCLMTSYEMYRPLNECDHELLYYMMKFPEKFWKISNHYYNSNKAWVSRRDIDKLNKIIEQETKRLSFLQKAFSFD